MGQGRKVRRRRRLRWIVLGSAVALLLVVGFIGGTDRLVPALWAPPGGDRTTPSLSGGSNPSSELRTFLEEAERTGDPSYYERALALSPDEVEARFQYGMALSLRDPRAALMQLGRVLEQEPEHLGALEAYGALMLRGERFAAAAKRYEQALHVLEERGERGSERWIKIAGSLGQAYVGWAGQLLEDAQEQELDRQARQLLAKAEPYLERALGADPTSDVILMALGDLYGYRGVYERAISYYRELRAHHSRNLAALVKIGRALFGLGRLAEAEAAFAQAWERVPELGPAALGLGDVYRAQGEIERAIHAYREGFERAPDRPFAAKERLALRLLELVPRETGARLWLADRYRKLHRYREAIRHYEQLLRDAGRDRLALAAHRGLGEVWQGLAEYARAKGHVRRAIELAPDLLHGEALVGQLVELYERLLQLDRAWRGAGRLLGPDGMEALLSLAKLYMRQGKLTAARAKLAVLERDYPFYHAEEAARLKQQLERRKDPEDEGQL